MREFVAHVGLPNGGVQAVTIKAWDQEDAIKRLLKLGYLFVNGCA